MLYEAFLWGSGWLEVWLSSECWNKLPTHVFAFGNLPKSAATVEEGPGGALLGLEGSWSTREGLEKNVLQIYSLRASVVLPAPNTIQFIPILFLPWRLPSRMTGKEACLLLIPRENKRYVECFRLLWEQKISVVSERKKKL